MMASFYKANVNYHDVTVIKDIRAEEGKCPDVDRMYPVCMKRVDDAPGMWLCQHCVGFHMEQEGWKVRCAWPLKR